MVVGIVLFMILYDKYVSEEKQLNGTAQIIIYVVSSSYLILLLIAGARRGLSLIKIDEKGIKLLIFGFIKFLDMKWDNIAEIRYYERFVPFIFISKTKNLEAKTYDYIIKQKDVIQLQLTKKVYAVLKKYAQQPIIGLTEERLTALKLN